MRNLIGLIGITSIVFTSCSKYQYATVESNLVKNDTSEFVHENDTFTIKYWFAGRNCPINIKVFNKSAKPLYVDWKKSALIVNEERFAYWNDESTLDVSSRGHISTSDDDTQTTSIISTTNASATGKIVRDEQVSFIPPQSYITVSRLKAKQEFFDLTNPTESQKILIGLKNGYMKGTRFRYLDEEKPLRFRSYLTLSTSEDFSDPIVFDDQFWVSDIITTAATPESRFYKPANQFFVHENTEFGNSMIAIAVIGIIIAPFLLFAEAVQSMPPY